MGGRLPWFAVGALDHEAFSSDARGWCARWADDGALSSLLVEYHRATRRARVRTQFLGSNPLEATVVASSQEHLLAAAFDPMPPGCDGALLRALNEDAVALPPRYGCGALWAPFGPLLVMAVPLHALQIDAFHDWMAARPMHCARDRVQAWVGLCASQLRYNDDWRPLWFSGVEAARAAFSVATGLPAFVEPAPLRDGCPGWLVERPVYAAFMLLPMAGIPALVADLRAAGFVASRHAAMAASAKGAGGLEMEAFLLTTAALENAGSLALQFGGRGLAEVQYTLTPCGSRVPWPQWLKYATQGGVASLPAPLQLPTPGSALRH